MSRAVVLEPPTRGPISSGLERSGEHMPDTAKGMLIVSMWVGRLEIIPVAVLLGAVLERLDLYR